MIQNFQLNASELFGKRRCFGILAPKANSSQLMNRKVKKKIIIHSSCMTQPRREVQ